jgi:hypothetical protein
MKAKPPLTVEQVVALAKRQGEVQVNPLKYRKWRGTSACFTAAKLGLLRKVRVNAGFIVFYPIT